jgi:hypothetical protein
MAKRKNRHTGQPAMLPLSSLSTLRGACGAPMNAKAASIMSEEEFNFFCPVVSGFRALYEIL